jgi:hypothetical protein
VTTEKEMLGSYGPKAEAYVCTTPRRGFERKRERERDQRGKQKRRQ